MTYNDSCHGQKTEWLFLSPIFKSDEVKKKRQKSYHHVGALGCTGARLAGLVLTALLEQLVMKAASLWMSSARL